jgi:hypothetical protein
VGDLIGGDVTERTEKTEENRDNGSSLSPSSPSSPSSLLHHAVAAAIRDSLPTAPGQRNRQVFELARALKAIPWLADAPVDSLKPYVRQWHQQALPHITTKPFEETWIDFFSAWPKVKFPKGAEPMVAVLERAKAATPPRAAAQYESPGVRLLVSLCRELQRMAGDQPFFLGCRTAAGLLGLKNRNGEDDHVTAWRWLRLLMHDKIIEEVEKGDRAKRRASRYRYLADL